MNSLVSFCPVLVNVFFRGKATSYAVRKCYQKTAFLIWDQKSASYAIRNVKIQLWNLGFVEAYENSILRGQGLST